MYVYIIWVLSSFYFDFSFLLLTEIEKEEAAKVEEDWENIPT